MKKYLICGILLILAGITYMYKDNILKGYYDYFVKETRDVVLKDKNEYYRDYDSGVDEFTFYCPEEYKNCTKEVKEIANDQVILSSINNYVHPFNSFNNIQTETDSLGKVKFKIKKSYSDTDIEIIKETIKNIEKEILNDNLSTKDQIKTIHDYIIDNSKYDSNRTDNNIIEYKSDIAYGPLIEGYGICGGYSDAMELFLEDLGIKSFKISSSSHVWNAVNLYDDWYHVDLTWDDPVTNTGEDFLDDKFLLIDTNTLQTEIDNIGNITEEKDLSLIEDYN